MVRHKIKFRYNGRADDVSITLAFRKKAIEQQRKEWLTGWIEEEETWFGGRNLCEKDTQAFNYTDFINKELVLFSNMDNERSNTQFDGRVKVGSVRGRSC